MKIVLATDGSVFAKEAEDFLLQITQPKSSTLKIVSVIDSPFIAAYGYEVVDVSAKLVESINRRTEQDLSESAGKFQETGWDVATSSLEGNPAAVIINYAKQEQAELLVTGARGLTGIARFLLGSVSSKIIRHAASSVLIQRDSATIQLELNKPLRIMIAIDGSASSLAAVDYVLKFPWKCKLEILLVRVIELVNAFNFDAIQRSTINWDQEVKKCQLSLNTIKDKLSAISDLIKTEIHQSATVGEQLLNCGKDWKADLMIVGHQGHGAVMQFLLGSVAYRIAERAHCSVLIVKK